jgi:hypothetical protein
MQDVPTGLCPKKDSGGVKLSSLAFIFLLAAAVVPWIVFSLKQARDHHHDVAPSPEQQVNFNTNANGDVELRSGSWGTLALSPFFIRPLDSALPAGWSRPESTTWFFPATNETALLTFFKGLNLYKDERADLSDVSKWRTVTNGFVITPSPETILSMHTETRKELYRVLAASPENGAYHQPWSLSASVFTEALESSGLSEDTQDLILLVAYTIGSRVFVSDANTVVNAIPNEAEKLRAIRFLKTAASYLVELRVNHGDSIAGLLEYWGERRREKDLRPIIESLAYAPQGGELDIVHLLPAFPRARLYSFPKPEDMVEGVRYDCHWSSLNFFSREPNAQFGDTDFVQSYVLENYYQSADPPSFGDIIFFTTLSGQTIHSAVHIAANLVFTKNGDDINQPWIMMDLDDVKELYEAFSHAAISVQVWKKKL